MSTYYILLIMIPQILCNLIAITVVCIYQIPNKKTAVELIGLTFIPGSLSTICIDLLWSLERTLTRSADRPLCGKSSKTFDRSSQKFPANRLLGLRNNDNCVGCIGVGDRSIGKICPYQPHKRTKPVCIPKSGVLPW